MWIVPVATIDEIWADEYRLKSQFLDTLATVKTARVHQRAKNNPFLSTGQISELKRELDEAIDYFNDALSHIKGWRKFDSLLLGLVPQGWWKIGELA